MYISVLEATFYRSFFLCYNLQKMQTHRIGATISTCEYIITVGVHKKASNDARNFA